MKCCTNTVRGILCVLGGFLIHLTYGYFYTIGNMSPYIVDYLNFHGKPVQSTSSVWLTTVGFSMQAIGMPLGAFVASKIGFRLVIFFSCFLHSGSIAITYFAIEWGFWAIVLFYGILTGFAFGVGYSVILAVTSAWFPKRRGLIVGLVLAGFGGGSLVFTPIQTALINPNNLPVNSTTKSFTNPEVLQRVPRAILIIAGIIAAMEIIGFALLAEKPKSTEENGETKLETLNRSTQNELNKDEEETQNTDKYFVNMDADRTVDFRLGVTMKSADFYLLWFAVAFAAIPITLVSSLFKIAGRNYIEDDLFLSGVSMAASVCNSVGRIIWGMICDRLSFKVPMSLMCIVWAAFLFSFAYISVFTGVAAKVTLVLWVSILFLCQCGLFVFAPNATTTIFGPLHLAVNYGVVYTAYLVGSLIASLMTNLSPKDTPLQVHFIVGGVMALITLVITQFVADRKAPRWASFLNLPVRMRARHNQ